ncbi:MAG TPA: thioredoxin family protein [Pseudonocardiaceae bacterium]|jgi:thiol-disulfide isomerase/thioredoxin|nr:thioredoxin family protein [Pseudonocardiaceae bacterium]
MDARRPAPAGLHPASPRLPVEGALPTFEGVTRWLQSAPLSPAGLRGKVVVVDFWTYTCVNWLRQLPYLRAWAAKYADQGLVVIGVHTPEFGFEHDPDNVRRAIADLRVTYPVAMDDDYAAWRAFGNHYWPTLYFADSLGRIRHHHFGEGEYGRSEMVIQQLLAEAGAEGVDTGLVSPEADGIEAPADWATLRSPETYAGYARATNFASPGGDRPDVPHTYTAPTRLRLNQWALSGEWTLREETVALNAPGGQVAYRFHARDLNLVMGAPAHTVRFQVRLDGQPPGAAHGADVDDQGHGTADGQRVYQLIRQPGPITDRTFEITFPDLGMEVSSFTFG